jgi:amino acid transporter
MTRPEKNLPRAIVTGIAVVIVAYVLFNLAVRLLTNVCASRRHQSPWPNGQA